MPHLRFEYSPGLGSIVDLGGFAAAMRDAMVATGVFPLGGIRVRGFEADVSEIADGRDGLHFLDIVVRMGEGRPAEVRANLADTLYAAARTVLEPQTGPVPFALSLEVAELSSAFSRKAWNTIHAATATT
jgi:5-carboxymethyl-2-hydroxymuconate isomerase